MYLVKAFEAISSFSFYFCFMLGVKLDSVWKWMGVFWPKTLTCIKSASTSVNIDSKGAFGL